MPAIPTLTNDVPVSSLRLEWRYTLARLTGSKQAAQFAPAFQAFGTQITAALAQETTVEDAVTIAVAGRDAADEELDDQIEIVAHGLLAVTKGDRDDPLFVSFFKSQTPSELSRPVLGPELATVQSWSAQLQAAPFPSLQALAPAFASAVQDGNTAATACTAADVAEAGFRSGARQTLVDNLNGARLSLLGTLGAFQKANPTLKLRANWAESFFRHGVRGAARARTLAEVQARHAKQTKDLAATSEELTALTAKETAKTTAKAAKATAKTELAAARTAVKTGKAQVKALAAAANKKLPK